MKLSDSFMKNHWLSLFLAATLAAAASAQTQTPPPAPTRPAAPRPAGRASARGTAPRSVATKVTVRDNSGTPISGATITIAGVGGAPLTTDMAGTVSAMLNAGSYRVRIDKEGFLSLERDVTVRAGQPTQVDVALDRAPIPPVPARSSVPEPARNSEPPRIPPTIGASAGPVGPPVTLSIPDFLDKNFIGGRDPLKETVIGCLPSGTTRLLQLRDPLAAHSHADMDETIYVVAGDGDVKVGDSTIAIGPGSITVVPRGLRHSIDRRGKNPLIVLSTLSGAPCPQRAAAGADTKR